ncbi:MAG: hypothetical protein H6659_03220 [Ardenticatenaceae bacterium]|nr:hypothetical protein [Ardenticatenaceae bacterium]
MDPLAETAVSLSSPARQFSFRRWWWLPFLFGCLAALIWVWADGRAVWSPVTAVDINQTRANTALPIPRDTLRLVQTFTPTRDGLAEIELVLAGNGSDGDDAYLFLQLFDAAGALVAERRVATRSLTNDQTYVFAFPPQPQSAGQIYTLQISGSSGNPISVRGYDQDVYAGGALRLQSGPLDTERPTTSAQDLRLITRYQLTWSDVGQTLATALAQAGWLFAVTLLFLPLPGVLMLLGGPAAWRHWDALAWLGTAVALGAAGWAILWQWVSLVGGRFTGGLLWVLVVGGWLLALFLWRFRLSAVGVQQRPSSTPSPRFHKEHAALLILLLAGFAVRLLAVRDLAFPPWVDASRHALITAVMVDKGTIPDNYAPYLPVDRFPYHFGFHTLSASLALMTGSPLAPLLLYLGQLLNALIPLAIYTAGWLLTRRRLAGLTAAFLVALPFFFPAYYLSWGRMTQLTAVLLLPVLLGLTWQLVRGGRAWRRVWWLVAVLAAGMFLVHFRVFLFYLPFAFIVWLISWGRNGRWLAAAAALAVFLAAPHMLNLLRVTEPVETVQHRIENYNTFPVAYLNVGWERPFLYVAGGLFVLLLIPALRRRRWTTAPLLLVGWVAVLFILLSGARLGLPETSLVNINSMYIIVFIPLSLFLGIAIARFWRWLRRRHWIWQAVGWFVTGAGITAVFIFGLHQQITVLNSQTVLAYPADLAGLAWLDANVPSDAKIAASSWKWLGETWAGSDGGAWILPLTGRETTIPPIDYIYNRDYFRGIREFNQAATDVADWAAPAAADWLREQGVDYVFVGARGGFFDPATLARNPQMRLLYGKDGVFVFAVSAPPS